MSKYSFAECLQNAYKVNWRIADVLADRSFDPMRPWLPGALSGAGGITCLDADEKRRLTHVEMAAYAHLFGYVEEFIAPKVASLALDYEVEQRVAFDALANFAAEEVKHMNLFRLLRDRVNRQLGFETRLLGGQRETARFVLSKRTGAVLLLTACVEWFTQRHYQECFKDDGTLDPFTTHVFKAHWLEESQHAKMDHLETLRAFDGVSPEQRQKAIDELIELVAAVDGLLRQQAEYDVQNLSTYLGREFTDAEHAEILDGVLAAKRHTFILSGVSHPRFEELFVVVSTPGQQQQVAHALEQLFPAGSLRKSA